MPILRKAVATIPNLPTWRSEQINAPTDDRLALLDMAVASLTRALDYGKLEVPVLPQTSLIAEEYRTRADLVREQVRYASQVAKMVPRPEQSNSPAAAMYAPQTAYMQQANPLQEPGTITQSQDAAALAPAVQGTRGGNTQGGNSSPPRITTSSSSRPKVDPMGLLTRPPQKTQEQPAKPNFSQRIGGRGSDEIPPNPQAAAAAQRLLAAIPDLMQSKGGMASVESYANKIIQGLNPSQATSIMNTVMGAVNDYRQKVMADNAELAAKTRDKQAAIIDTQLTSRIAPILVALESAPPDQKAALEAQLNQQLSQVMAAKELSPLNKLSILEGVSRRIADSSLKNAAVFDKLNRWTAMSQDFLQTVQPDIREMSATEYNNRISQLALKYNLTAAEVGMLSGSQNQDLKQVLELGNLNQDTQRLATVEANQRLLPANATRKQISDLALSYANVGDAGIASLEAKVASVRGLPEEANLQATLQLAKDWMRLEDLGVQTEARIGELQAAKLKLVETAQEEIYRAATGQKTDSTTRAMLEILADRTPGIRQILEQGVDPSQVEAARKQLNAARADLMRHYDDQINVARYAYQREENRLAQWSAQPTPTQPPKVPLNSARPARVQAPAQPQLKVQPTLGNPNLTPSLVPIPATGTDKYPEAMDNFVPPSNNNPFSGNPAAQKLMQQNSTNVIQLNP